MLSSMTAFQRMIDKSDRGSMTIELKTVNHRYLDINIRMPDDLRMLEPKMRELIQKKLSRGKIDCTLRMDMDDPGSSGIEVNEDLAARLIRSAESLPISKPAAIDPMKVLKWPGVVSREETDLDTLAEPVCNLLDRALCELVRTRQREGEKLRETILSRCDSMKEELASTRESLPRIIEGLRNRYRDKLDEILAEPDYERLEQEILFLVQKMDVTEELDRLDIHLNEVERVIELDEPVGRRLDFLMQELNREANTLASKAAHVDTSNSSIELKVLIEQLREQIQNIE